MPIYVSKCVLLGVILGCLGVWLAGLVPVNPVYSAAFFGTLGAIVTERREKRAPRLYRWISPFVLIGALVVGFLAQGGH